MKIDGLGLVVEDNGSGGDSAHYSGLAVIATKHIRTAIHLHFLVGIDGLAVRHPTHEPWNNPKNFTRDQLMPLVAGLYAQKKYEKVRPIFWSHAKRFFFCQNIERDRPGSRKYPWPHTFINFRGQEETRSFDFADPLFPSHICALARAGNFQLACLLWPLAICFVVLELIAARVSRNTDLGALISTCYLLGVLPLFKLFIPDYKARLDSYFHGWRNMSELCRFLKAFIENSSWQLCKPKHTPTY